MSELLAYLARELVDDPEAVRVEEEERDDALVLVLHVAPDDVGKVIGRQGRIARALRTLVRASSARDGRRVFGRDRRSRRNEVAALYDVHAMPWALEAVLAAVDAEKLDKVVFGGDYLYGPYPRETVAMIRALDAIVLRGNCEDLAEEWERAELAPGDLEWLQSLPLAAIVDDVLYCHATPDDNTADHDGDHARRCGARDVRRHARHGRDRAHAPSVRPVGSDGLRVVNAGSVGMAYESDVAAYWTILDDGEPSFRRTRFDVAARHRRDAGERLAACAGVHRREPARRRRPRRGDRAAREPPRSEGRRSGRSAARTGSTERSSSSSRPTTRAGGRPVPRSSRPACRSKWWRTAPRPGGR